MKPSQVDDPDPMMRAAVAEAFNTGRVVVAKRGPDGTIEMRSHPVPEHPKPPSE